MPIRQLLAPSVLALALGLALPPAASAQEGIAIAPDCFPLVGTFLATKTDEDGTTKGAHGRILVSLTNGGHAFMNDSDQGGGEGYAAFTTARGAWTCDGLDGLNIAFGARMMDFTLKSAENEDQQIVSVTVSGKYDPVPEILTGETTVAFFPLHGDPMADTPTETVKYTFKGGKVVAPGKTR